MLVSELINVNIGLSAVPASQANFGVAMLLVDHADIPVDRRYLQVTRASYQTDLTSGTTHYNWCSVLWGQNYNPAQAYIARWISAATAAYMVFPNAVATPATYAALTNTGKIKIVEGATNEDISPDFTGDTSMADVAASITVALAGSTNFTGYVCSVDALDRLIITSDNTGSTAAAVSAASPGSGVDLTGSSYLGAEFSVAGFDAEALEDAVAAVLAVDNTPFVICQRGGSINQVVALSTAVNALDKLLLLVSSDANTKSAVATSDFAYQIHALSHQKTHIVYTEHTTQHPDAAICGEILPRTEGTTSFALTGLSGVSESGLGIDGNTVKPLTVAERTALDNKGCDYLVNPAGITHLRHGLAVGGNEMRIMIGKSFMAAKTMEDVYAYKIVNPVVTYSDSDIQAFKGIIDYWASEMVSRKVLATYTITMPSAADFTAAEKATHTMTLSDVLTATVQSAVNDMVITMSFTI